VNNIAIAKDTTIQKLVCGSGDYNITSNSAGDTIVVGHGNDTINGGTGTDSVVFSGVRSAYTITTLSSTSVRVSDPDGTDTLTNLEKLQFSDQTVNLSTSPSLNPDLSIRKCMALRRAPLSIIRLLILRTARECPARC
jgi:Ca2+-binding RTX toxin-like protein